MSFAALHINNLIVHVHKLFWNCNLFRLGNVVAYSYIAQTKLSEAITAPTEYGLALNVLLLALADVKSKLV